MPLSPELIEKLEPLVAQIAEEAPELAEALVAAIGEEGADAPPDEEGDDFSFADAEKRMTAARGKKREDEEPIA